MCPVSRPKPRQRDREATKLRLLKAVGTLLARQGFSAFGVNSLAREAGTDKTMIYRYYGSVGNVLKAYAEQGDFWPSDEELLNGRSPLEFTSRPASEVIPLILCNWIDALRRRPITLEILAWEMVERNEVTAVLEDLRERQAQRFYQIFGEAIQGSSVDLRMLPTILICAIHYILLRARKINRFGSLDLRDEATFDQLKSFIHDLCRAYILHGAPAGNDAGPS